MLHDPELDALVIATRHNSHARLVIEALAAGKHVFVEKPLALTADDIDAIDRAYRGVSASERAPRLMVGFNRRFAPQVVRMRALLEAQPGPKSMIMTVNAGAISTTHWTQDSRSWRWPHRRRGLPFYRFASPSRGLTRLSPPIVRQWPQKPATQSASRLPSRMARSERSITSQMATRPSRRRRTGDIRRRPNPPARQLPFAHRLRLEEFPHNETVASRQGAESVRRGVP